MAKNLHCYWFCIYFAWASIGCETKNDTQEQLEYITPTWSDDASLDVVPLGESRFGLLWSAVESDDPNTSYVVYQDQKQMATLPFDVNSLQLGVLQPGSYAFQVQARVHDGEESRNGPRYSLDVLDTLAPHFEATTELLIEAISATELRLKWKPAVDDVAVARYRIYQNDELLGEIEYDKQDFLVSGVEEGQSYTFRVEALDEASNISARSLVATIRHSDQSPPSWEDNAMLSIVEVTESSFWLSWDQATDNVAVSKYRVYVDGLEYGLTEISRPHLLVDGRAEFESYSVEVFAEDQSGNQSTSSLAASVQTLDISAPSWGTESRMTFTRTGLDTISLNWQPALDNDRIEKYLIFKDNLQIGEVDANTQQFSVNLLATSRTYHFRVEALDRATNLSSDGPVTLVQLADQSPPTWQEMAMINVVELTASEVQFTWIAAIDNEDVEHYNISIDGVISLAVDGAVTSATVNGLPANTGITLGIHAVDQGGNQSEELTIEIEVPDFDPPIWPVGSQLNASEYQATSLLLSWTPLPASPSLSEYKIYQTGQLIATLTSELYSYRVGGLTPNTQLDFKVEAAGPTGQESNNGPSLQTMTETLLAPEWPVSAELQATDVLDQSLTLVWSAVLLENSMLRYEIYRGEILIGTTAPSVRTINVDDLVESTRYTFTVRCIDDNETAVLGGPSLSLTTLDLTPPEWTMGGEIRIESIGETEVLLSWEPANDTVGTSIYQITTDTGLEWESDQSAMLIDGLEPSTEYRFTINAYDLAGNQSETSLHQTVTTLASSQVNSQEVYDGLSPHCAGCHASGDSAYFASFENFEALVVNNTDLITPGLPSQSIFVQVLRGEGIAPWSSMPPFGSQNYNELVEAGTASLSMESIEDWVLEMGEE
ncbi:MAG: hypothetical protein CMH49_07560 [Myxococcales bacterium]|nr:hypothetical protein [Myxococcales bacterium]